MNETYEASPATTSESSESPATAAAVRLMQTKVIFALAQ